MHHRLLLHDLVKCSLIRHASMPSQDAVVGETKKQTGNQNAGDKAKDAAGSAGDAAKDAGETL